MKLTKEPIYSAQTKGRPVMGRFRGLTMLFGAFLVIFVSAPVLFNRQNPLG
jgi:hypothetical protein